MVRAWPNGIVKYFGPTSLIFSWVMNDDVYWHIKKFWFQIFSFYYSSSYYYYYFDNYSCSYSFHCFECLKKDFISKIKFGLNVLVTHSYWLNGCTFIYIYLFSDKNTNLTRRKINVEKPLQSNIDANFRPYIIHKYV